MLTMLIYIPNNYELGTVIGIGEKESGRKFLTVSFIESILKIACNQFY